MSTVAIYRQLLRNTNASTTTKSRKNAPIKRGIHQNVYDRSSLQDFEQALGRVVGSQLLPSCDPKAGVQ
jgi:hypothetical protein